METITHISILVPLFFLVAMLYAIAGLGGASTYLALLVMAGAQINEIAPVTLLCNIIVTFGTVIQFGRHKVLPVGIILPFILFSVPASFIGGMMKVGEPVLKIVLAICLFIAGLYLLNYSRFKQNGSMRTPRKRVLWTVALITGGTIGLISGMVGIGGGIFLAPTLYLLRWIDSRQVAAASSFFILVNSTGGLLGHSVTSHAGTLLVNSIPLVIAVLFGGLIGGHLSSRRLNPDTIRMVTAIVVLFASIRIVLSEML